MFSLGGWEVLAIVVPLLACVAVAVVLNFVVRAAGIRRARRDDTEVSSFLCKGPVDQPLCRMVREGVCWGTGRRKR